MPSFIDTSVDISNFQDIVSLDTSLPYSALGNTSGNFTLEANKVTTAHVTGNHTLTLPTVSGSTRQVVCIFDFTTTNSAYPSITNSNIKLKDGNTITYSALTGTVKSVTGATNTSPIEITVTSHGYQTGDVVVIASVGGNTAANGSWTITRTGANTFTLNGSTGNSNYTSGGTSTRYGIRNKLTFTSNNGSDNWEVKHEKFGGTEVSFTFPTNMSSNGTLGGASFAVAASSYIGGFEVYKAFDAITTDGWVATTDTNEYITFYNPVPIKVSNLHITNRSAGQGYTNYIVYGSNDNSNFTSIATGTNTNHTGSGEWDIPISSGNQGYYYYYKIFGSTGVTYIGAATISGTAVYLTG